MAPSLSGEESYSDPTAASDRSRNGTAAGVVQDSVNQYHPRGEHSSTTIFLNGFELPVIPLALAAAAGPHTFHVNDQGNAGMSTLHAANNSGIAFTELKDRVTAGQSLSAAIQDLKPGTDAKAAANSAATIPAGRAKWRMKAIILLFPPERFCCP